MAKKNTLKKPRLIKSDVPFHGLAPVAEKVARFIPLLARYFRYEVVDAEHLPENGGAVLAMNHSFTMVDQLLFAHHFWRKKNKLPQIVVDHATWRLPVLRRWMLAHGVPDGTRTASINLLKERHWLMVCPGGAKEGLKSVRKKYQLFWRRHFGFVQTAIAAGVPIIPCVAIGADEVYVVLNDGYYWGRKIFRRRYMPLPLFFGLGLWPIPIKITHYIGKPIYHHLPPQAAGDRLAVRKLHKQVIREAHRLIRRARRERRLMGLAREHMEVLEDVVV